MGRLWCHLRAGEVPWAVQHRVYLGSGAKKGAPGKIESPEDLKILPRSKFYSRPDGDSRIDGSTTHNSWLRVKCLLRCEQQRASAGIPAVSEILPRIDAVLGSLPGEMQRRRQPLTVRGYYFSPSCYTGPSLRLSFFICLTNQCRRISTFKIRIGATGLTAVVTILPPERVMNLVGRSPEPMPNRRNWAIHRTSP
jgi:hypothetical protein